MISRIVTPVVAVILLLSVTIFPVEAATETVVRDVTAHGDTRELAIINAVVEGIQQVHGISLDVQKQLSTSFKEVMRGKGSDEEQSFESTMQQRQDLLKRAKGYVKTYEVLDAEKIEGGTVWEVTIRVQIPKYVATGQDRSKMRTMAVLPFRVQRQMYKVGSDGFPAEEISWQLNHKLISELTQARKFRILDREYIAEFEAEKALLNSGEVPVEETLRLGQRLGSDFMIVGVITDYKITERKKETLGVVKTKRSASTVFEYRVIEVAPQEIRWSGSVDMDLGHRALKKLTPSDDLIQVQNAFLAENAAVVATEVLEVIFPIKVLSIEGNLVTLNQGGIRVMKGQLFDVFTVGKKVVDPDTGRKIRTDGPRVGTVEVVSVLPKYSVARLVDGNIEMVVERAICRRLEVQVEPEKKSATSATVNW